MCCTNDTTVVQRRHMCCFFATVGSEVIREYASVGPSEPFGTTVENTSTRPYTLQNLTFPHNGAVYAH